MKRATIGAALCLTLAGCTAVPNCYVGVSLFPLAPFVTCGVDFSPKDKAGSSGEEDEDVRPDTGLD